MVRISAISPSSSHRRPIVARTISANRERAEKPSPAPYIERARANASWSCGEGEAKEPRDSFRNRVYGGGSDFMLVWRRRERAAFENATATPGGPVASRFLVIDRRLLRHETHMNFISRKREENGIKTYSSTVALAIKVSTIRLLVDDNQKNPTG